VKAPALGGEVREPVRRSERVCTATSLQIHPPQVADDVQHIGAIDFAVANRLTLGIDVINLSLGHPIYEPAATDPLVQAVEAASRAGIVVVTASGNAGINPRSDGMVIGNSQEVGIWSLEPNPEIIRRNLTNAATFFAGMNPPEAGVRLTRSVPPATAPPVESFFGWDEL